MKTIVMALAMLGLASPVMAQDSVDRRIVVENHTGKTIYSLYGSNVESNDWEEDILQDGVITASQHQVVNMNDGTGACHFDFKAVFADGRYMIRRNVDVCREVTLTFGPLMHGATN